MNSNPSRKKKGGRPILCLDFDGVLHAYRTSFRAADIIDDEPVPGAVEFVTQAQQFFKIMVYSSRSNHPGGIEAMQQWMEKHGFPSVSFAREKPAAFLTLDDRALQFNGVFPDPEQLRAFRPWNRQPEPDIAAEATEAGRTDTSSSKERPYMFKELVCKNRSYRRFDQSEPIEMETLLELIELARLTPSAANMQPLRYYLSNEAEKNALIYQHLGWAGYLKDWPGPEEGERPAAYVVILGDTNVSKNFGCDHGITAQTILLGAAEKGLGGCMIGSIKRKELSQALNLPAQYEILLVLALGKPIETVVLEGLPEDGSVRYWRDEQQIHHVPKRTLEDMILK